MLTYLTNYEEFRILETANSKIHLFLQPMTEDIIHQLQVTYDHLTDGHSECEILYPGVEDLNLEDILFAQTVGVELHKWGFALQQSRLIISDISDRTETIPDFFGLHF